MSFFLKKKKTKKEKRTENVTGRLTVHAARRKPKPGKANEQLAGPMETIKMIITAAMVIIVEIFKENEKKIDPI